MYPLACKATDKVLDWQQHQIADVNLSYFCHVHKNDRKIKTGNLKIWGMFCDIETVNYSFYQRHKSVFLNITFEMHSELCRSHDLNRNQFISTVVC